MIVRAKQKPVEHFDPELICCEGLSRQLRDSFDPDMIYLLDSEDVVVTACCCKHCGNRWKAVRWMKIISPKHQYSHVILAYYDIDEQPVPVADLSEMNKDSLALA